MNRFYFFLRAARALAVLGAFAWPAIAFAVATNLTLSTPAGPVVKRQVIVLDASDHEVARKDTDDRGLVAFDLPAGSYHVRAGSESSTVFRVTEPGPLGIALDLGVAAAAAASVPWEFDLEAGYRYDSGSFSTRSAIDGLALDPVSESIDLNTNGGLLTGRIHFPVEFCGARPFFEVGGDIYGSTSRNGARFGMPGIGGTGLNTTQVELQSSVFFGGGVRWGLPVGPSEIGISPTLGFTFDNGRLRSIRDESAFGFPVETENKGFTATRLTLGGNLELRPCREGCGFYLFAGGQYGFAISGSDASIEGQMPGGLDSRNEIRVGDRWQAQVGAGYRFSLPF